MLKQLQILMIVCISMMVIPSIANAQPLPSDCPTDEFYLQLFDKVNDATKEALQYNKDEVEAERLHNSWRHSYEDMFNRMFNTVADAQWWNLGKNCRK